MRPKLSNRDEVACPASRRAPLDLADADSTISTCLRSIMPGVDHPWLRPASSGPSAASILKLALHHPWSIGTTLSLRPSPRAVDRHAASTTCATQAKEHVTRHGVVNHSSHKGSELPLVPQGVVDESPIELAGDSCRDPLPGAPSVDVLWSALLLGGTPSSGFVS